MARTEDVHKSFSEVIAEYIPAGVLPLCRGLFSYRDNQRRHIRQAVFLATLITNKINKE